MILHRAQSVARHREQPAYRRAAALGLAAAALLAVAGLAGPAVAQSSNYSAQPDDNAAEPAGHQTPKALREGVGVEPNPGAELPLDLTFTNAAGEEVTLGRYFNGEKPVLFTLAYYSCPMLCQYIRDGMIQL
jgi:cytochrome oxidase Cu insertion factor (SCO1/SenC/PrrC family)